MYLMESMAEADALRPNTIGDEQKAEWIEQMERRFAETTQIPPRVSSFPDDKELLMPPPVDRVYVFWLCAMIDWAQLDGDLYAIDMSMYNEAYKEAIAWWRRNHVPIVNEAGARWKGGMRS